MAAAARWDVFPPIAVMPIEEPPNSCRGSGCCHRSSSRRNRAGHATCHSQRTTVELLIWNIPPCQSRSPPCVTGAVALAMGVLFQQLDSGEDAQIHHHQPPQMDDHHATLTTMVRPSPKPPPWILSPTVCACCQGLAWCTSQGIPHRVRRPARHLCPLAGLL